MRHIPTTDRVALFKEKLQNLKIHIQQTRWRLFKWERKIVSRDYLYGIG